MAICLHISCFSSTTDFLSMIKTQYWKTVVQRPKSKCVLFWAQEHSVPEKDSCKFANTQPAYRHNWHRVTLAIVFFWPPEIQDEKWNIPLWAVVWSEMSGAICKIINYWSLTWLIFIILRPNDSCFITNLVYANASSCSISPPFTFLDSRKWSQMNMQSNGPPSMINVLFNFHDWQGKKVGSLLSTSNQTFICWCYNWMLQSSGWNIWSKHHSIGNRDLTIYEKPLKEKQLTCLITWKYWHTCAFENNMSWLAVSCWTVK